MKEALTVFFAGLAILTTFNSFKELKTLKDVQSMINSGRLQLMKLFQEGKFIDEAAYLSECSRRINIHRAVAAISSLSFISILTGYFCG